jgi:hypothetical protein
MESRTFIWVRNVACMREKRNAYKMLVSKHEGKRRLVRPRGGSEDDTKMDLREIGYEEVEWINLAQDRRRWRALVKTVMNLRVSQKQGNFVTS